METTIKVKATGDNVNFIFDRGFINIRHFECENPNYEPTESNYFYITIRHNENEKPNDLFTTAIIDCKNIMQLRKNKARKIKQLQEKVLKLTENLTAEIQSVCEMMPYKDSSVFSYNIDRLKQFNDGLQEFTA